MAADVPNILFLSQIKNATVQAVLSTSATLPDTISPTTFLFSIVEGLERAQSIFNAENDSLPNVATVSGREIGPIDVASDGGIQSQVFYTIGGHLTFNVGSADPIIL